MAILWMMLGYLIANSFYLWSINTSNRKVSHFLDALLDFPQVLLEKTLIVLLMPMVILCKFFYLFFKGVPYSQWDAHRPTKFWRVGRCILVYDKKTSIPFHKLFLMRLTGKRPTPDLDGKNSMPSLDLRLDN